MPNYFDQFDEAGPATAEAPSGNFFDQFDEVAEAPPLTDIDPFSPDQQNLRRVMQNFPNERAQRVWDQPTVSREELVKRQTWKDLSAADKLAVDAIRLERGFKTTAAALPKGFAVHSAGQNPYNPPDVMGLGAPVTAQNEALSQEWEDKQSAMTGEQKQAEMEASSMWQLGKSIEKTIPDSPQPSNVNRPFGAAAEGAGSLGASMAMAPLGVAPMMSGMFLMELSDAYESEIARQQDTGEPLNPGKASAKASLYAAGAIPLEYIGGAGRLARRWFGAAAENEVRELARKGGGEAVLAFFSERAKDAAMEGGTESLQRLWQDAIVHGKPNIAAALQEGASAAGGSLLLGGAAQGTRLAGHKAGQAFSEARSNENIDQALQESGQQIALEQSFPPGFAPPIDPAQTAKPDGNYFDKFDDESSESQSPQNPDKASPGLNGTKATPAAVAATPAPAGASDQREAVMAELEALPGGMEDIARPGGKPPTVEQALSNLTAVVADLQATLVANQGNALLKPSVQPDATGKPAQTITGSNVQTGTEMPVQAKPGAAIPVGQTPVQPVAPPATPNKPTFAVGQKVAVRLSNRSNKEHLARITQLQPDGSAQVQVEGEKTFRMVAANQLMLTKTDRARRAKQEELATVPAEQQEQVKADAAEFAQVVEDYAPQLEWAPGEAYDRNTAMQEQGVENARLRNAAIERAMRTVLPEGQWNSVVDRARALPKLVEYLTQQFPGDNSIAKRRALEDFSTSETEASPALEQQQAIVDRLAASNPGLPELKGLRAVGVRNAGAKVQLRPGHGTGTGGKPGLPSAATAELAQLLERLYDLNIIFVDSAGALPFNGVKFVGTKTALIHVRAGKPMLTVAGHELLHHIKETHPGLYAELVAAVGEMDIAGYRSRLTDPAYAGKSDAQITEELLADLLGDSLADPTFLKSLAQQDPNLFKRFARIAIVWLDKLLDKLKGVGFSRYNVSQHIADIEAARESLRTMLVEAAKETQYRKAGIGETGNAEHRTSNIQHPTSNEGAAEFSKGVDSGDKTAGMSPDEKALAEIEKHSKDGEEFDERGVRKTIWNMGRSADDEGISINRETVLDDDDNPTSDSSFEVYVGEGSRRAKSLSEAWNIAKGYIEEAAADAKSEAAAVADFAESRAILKDKTVQKITESDLFDAVMILSNSSRQSDSIYPTVYLRPKTFEIAQRIAKGENDNLQSDTAAVFARNRDEFDDYVAIKFRIADHPATDSAKSTPDIDLRIGDPRKPKQRRDSARRGAPDTPDEWYDTWSEAAGDVINKALEFVGDKTGQVEGRNLSAAPLHPWRGEIKTEGVTGKPASNFGISSPQTSTPDKSGSVRMGQGVSDPAQFSKDRGDDLFSFAAPESVSDQKSRLAAEKRKADEAQAKAAMQERAGAKLTGSDLDTTKEMFGAEVRQDKSGQGALFSKERGDYVGNHTAPQSDSGSPAWNLNSVYPDDIYGANGARYYGHYGDGRDAEAISVIRTLRGHPDRRVWIYRAVPRDVKKKSINRGDWVTTVRGYAVEHGKAQFDNYRVISRSVKARDIFTNGDSIFEWGYDPQTQATFAEENYSLNSMRKVAGQEALFSKERQEESTSPTDGPFRQLQDKITKAEAELMAAIRQHIKPPEGMTKATALSAKNAAVSKLNRLLAEQLKQMTSATVDAARSPEQTAELIAQTVSLLNHAQDEIATHTARSEAIPAGLTQLRQDLQTRLNVLKGWTEDQTDLAANGQPAPRSAPKGRDLRKRNLESATDGGRKGIGDFWNSLKAGLRYLTSPIPELPLTGERAEKSALFRRGYRLFAVENNAARAAAAEKINRVLEPLTKLGRKGADNAVLREYYQLGHARQRAAMNPAQLAKIDARMAALEAELNKDPFDLFRRLVLYRDLWWRGTYLKNEQGKPITLPQGLIVEDVADELRKLTKLISEHKDGLAITEALRRHYALTDELQKSILAHGEIIPESLRNPLYFPHHVIDHWTGNFARVRATTEEDVRKYLIAPVGSGALIQTDYLKAMMLHTADVLAHNARIDLVQKYWQPYDISEQLKDEHGKDWNKPWNIPPGYKVFTPYKKLPLRMDYILSREVMAEKLGVLFNDGDLRERLGESGLVLKVKPEDLHAALVAGEKIQWALPSEITDALNGIARREAAAANPGLGHSLGLPLRALNNFWKKTTLFAPWNWIRYEYGNLSTDAIDKVLAADPAVAKHMARAARELWESGLAPEPPGGAGILGRVRRQLDAVSRRIGYGELTPEFKAAQREGVFETITAGEAGELAKLPQFKAFLTTGEARWDNVRTVLAAPMRGSKFREGVFRYAKFLADVERLRAGKEPVYAGAFHGDIEALGEDVDGQRRLLDGDELIFAKAAEISLKTYGDYQSLGVVGQWLRQYAIPFWSWQDVNFRYHANQLRNIADGIKGVPGGTERTAALRYAGIRVVSTLLAVGIAKELWNQFGGVAMGLWDEDDDLESKLSEADRRRGHLLLGKDANGQVKVVYTPSAWSDVVEWTGGQNMKRLFMEYVRGQITLNQFIRDYAKQLPMDVGNKAAQSGGPLLKAPYELASGRATFPDVFDQRNIPEADKWWRFVGGLTDQRVVGTLRAAFDQDYYSQPATEQLQQIILQIRRRDPEQWAYYEAREDASDWKEAKTGKRFEHGSYNAPEALALRNFRKSIYRGDVANAERFYNRLIQFGYTAERLDASIRNQHPLSNLTTAERSEYAKTLTTRQKEELELASKYYSRLKALDHREKFLFKSKQVPNRDPNPALLRQIVEDQSRNK